jgi:hypothetical protein
MSETWDKIKSIFANEKAKQSQVVYFRAAPENFAKYDPMSLVKEVSHDGKRVQFIVDPGDVLPPTVERIRQVLQTPWVLPEELINLNDIDPSIVPKHFVERAQRGLDYPQAWSWFKRALALAHGGSYHLHILRNENYKEVSNG